MEDFKMADLLVVRSKIKDYAKDGKDEFKVEFQPEKAPEAERARLAAPAKLWKIVAKFAGLFAIIFIITFILVNFSALKKGFRWTWKVSLLRQPYSQIVAVPTPVFDPETPAKLLIPKIEADAPITWNVNEDNIQAKLLDGLVHSQGTALPGQKGNIFITGHSSYYAWSSSPYKSVFALLEKLEAGDRIYIQYQGTTFTYEVKETKVVSPENVEVMNQSEGNELTLMTCVPIGTNLNRLIIKSTQIPS